MNPRVLAQIVLNASVQNAPIDIYQLCRDELNVQLYLFSTEFECTRIINRGPSGEIYLVRGNDVHGHWGDFYPGEEFVVAHSLGHLLLHCGYLKDPHPYIYEDSVIKRPLGHAAEQYAANVFALELLYPDKYFDSFIKPKETTIKYLMSVFEVPEWVIQMRLKLRGYETF